MMLTHGPLREITIRDNPEAQPVKTGSPTLDQCIAVMEYARPGRKIMHVYIGSQPWEPQFFEWDGPIEEIPDPAFAKRTPRGRDA